MGSETNPDPVDYGGGVRDVTEYWWRHYTLPKQVLLIHYRNKTKDQVVLKETTEETVSPDSF